MLFNSLACSVPSRFIPPAVIFHRIKTLRNFSTMDLSDMRKSYRTEADALVEDKLPSRDPFQLFKLWFQAANESGKLLEANAVCVTTCTKSGVPSSRMVLLKGFSETDGFRFFTNGYSRKAQEIKENPNACMLFYWDPLNQQVRIEGQVEQLDFSAADGYFQRRPKGSQLSASISKQSQPIESRAKLIELHDAAEEQFKDMEKIPTPDHWVGFSLKPSRFEFWQGQTNRLHDRLVFIRQDSGWLLSRLQP